MMRPETVDTMAETGSRATYVGGAASVFGWMSLNEFAAVGGLVLAVAGFILNWYYKHVADRRAREMHEAEMRRLRGDSDGQSES